jgi:hypothetical protein
LVEPVGQTDRLMERKKAVIKEIHQKESTVEVGQSTIDKGSRVSFRRVLTPTRVLF